MQTIQINISHKMKFIAQLFVCHTNSNTLCSLIDLTLSVGINTLMISHDPRQYEKVLQIGCRDNANECCICVRLVLITTIAISEMALRHYEIPIQRKLKHCYVYCFLSIGKQNKGLIHKSDPFWF